VGRSSGSTRPLGRSSGSSSDRALEEAAAELGYARVVLDTGERLPEARALFRSAGYVEIADYNGNPWAAYWFEKRLSHSADPER
jgi:hypothetical protein